MLTTPIQEIAAKQPFYTSEKYHDSNMVERGKAVKDLEKALRSETYIKQFKEALKPFEADIGVEGKDGDGTRSIAPWVRIYSERFASSAREGYYVVFHFSTDGKRVFVTLGCAAAKSRDSDVQKSKEELKDQKICVEKLIQKVGIFDMSLYQDTIDIGSNKTRPKGYERATIFCRSYYVAEINDQAITEDVCFLLRVLSKVYEGYEKGQDVPSHWRTETEIDEATSAKGEPKGGGQGMNLTPDEKKEVELQAMRKTGEYLDKEGYKWEDVSANNNKNKNKHYDIKATKDGKTVCVEVKGTLSLVMNVIFMSANEERFHFEKAMSQSSPHIYQPKITTGNASFGVDKVICIQKPLSILNTPTIPPLFSICK